MYALLAGIVWLISCKGKPESLPAPVPVVKQLPTPVVKLSKADSTKAAWEAFNGERPIYLDGDTLTLFNNPIVGAPNDTVYFNKSRWSHWPLVKRSYFVPPNGNIYVSFVAGMSTDRIYESTSIILKPRKGLHKNSDIIHAGLTVGDKGPHFSYDPDPKKESWVNVTDFDAKKGLVNGEFSLHLVLEPNQERRFYDKLYPKSFHFHGKLHEL